jgi:hypothetical protein
MPSRLNRVIVLRWIFLIAGVFLLFGGGIILGFHTVARQLADVFDPGDSIGQRTLITSATLVSLAVSILCLASAWGIQQGKRWTRPTGILASCGLITMFSPLSLAGFWGLWALAKPLEFPAEGEAEKSSTKSKDYWVAARKSQAQQVKLLIRFVALVVAAFWVKSYAANLGMRSWDPGVLSLPFLLLIDVAVHQMGHVAMAWALHNRLRMINIGPFTFQDVGYDTNFTSTGNAFCFPADLWVPFRRRMRTCAGNSPRN